MDCEVVVGIIKVCPVDIFNHRGVLESVIRMNAPTKKFPLRGLELGFRGDGLEINIAAELAHVEVRIETALF